MRAASPPAPLPPARPEGVLHVEAPPDLLRPEGGLSGLMMAMPAIGSVGSVALIAFGSPGSTSVLRYVFAGCVLMASLGFVVAMVTRNRVKHARAVTASRRGYLTHLDGQRHAVLRAARAQRAHDLWHLPPPSALAVLIEAGDRVWERTSADSDLLLTRLGTSPQDLALRLEPAAPGPMSDPDPTASAALQRFLATHAVQHDLPLGLDLRDHSHLQVHAEATTAGLERARGLVRALLCHLATFTSAQEVRIAVVRTATDGSITSVPVAPGPPSDSDTDPAPRPGGSPDADPDPHPSWSWLRWLPHACDPGDPDSLPASGTWPTLQTAVRALDLDARPAYSPLHAMAAPHVVLVVDGPIPPGAEGSRVRDGVQGVTVVSVDPRPGDIPPFGALVRLVGGSVLQRGAGPVAPLRPDSLSAPEATAIARRLAAPAAARCRSQGQHGAPSSLMELLGLPPRPESGDITTVRRTWQARAEEARLHVPLGVDEQGAPVMLDLKESAEGGLGPHGLLIGATGSGKSEVLRTLVLALTLTHDPEQLNLLLVDFKGGATFAPIAPLPHVSAVITNLGEELDLVERMAQSLQGELTRRQELLRRTGPFAGVAEYERARRGGREDLEPLPTLLIVCDEFSELLAARPEFAETFAAIGRLGRSLRVHLLLASQRLEEGRLRGLESHLSYRIGLRTFSAAESRQVLGVPDAHTLPAEPGLGLLRGAPTQLRAFRASYVSGPAPTPALTPTPEPGAPDTLLSACVAAMTDLGAPAHRIWLPPLTSAPALGALLGDLAEDPTLGLHSPTWREHRALPVAVVDLPREQRRETLTVPLDGAGGNIAVVGGPRSGTSTALRTIVAALALTHTPLEVQVFALDLSGGLGPVHAWPQVAGYARRRESDVVRRSVAEVATILRQREGFFADHGIDSITDYRARRAPGCDDGYGEIYLVIDDYAALRADHEDLTPVVQDIAARGLAFGVHIIVSAKRWLDLRAALKDALGTRLELRLGETTDSVHSRRLAQSVPADVPGRGLTPQGHAMLLALPLADQSRASDGEAQWAARLTAAWRGPAGPRLRLLPDRISRQEITSGGIVREDAIPPGTPDRPTAPSIMLGLEEESLHPFLLDGNERVLTVFGDAGSGKSSLLRLLAQEVTHHAPSGAGDQVLVLDPRRSLLSDVAEPALLGYAASHEAALAQVTSLAEYLRGRLPGAEVTPAQLRTRSWWHGAEVTVLADDYDLLTTSQGSALAPLVPLLPFAADIGLRLVFTRRTGGAARASFDPVLQAARDLGAPGILLSGDPAEGALVGGVKARHAPPGRALLVHRGQTRVLQLAYEPPRA
ncbi:type VII secretion protein EccCa [Serinibacter salmoneus]|uniref:S-DNA-T family DNA segregation ATPase FtsK/SpoIIIE n=1 Tax=Serinibacter salmoneus TaxID=556530 RepID=A0A2A9D4L9_9MICO|nr:type VII secretion protein EccCa [Serinibacter salmoneus]PFG21276.1 S-DNA-T family DNA segregation ATPase FtsK/SpoIIIE [Serinibacter salmoneus]